MKARGPLPVPRLPAAASELTLAFQRRSARQKAPTSFTDVPPSMFAETLRAKPLCDVHESELSPPPLPKSVPPRRGTKFVDRSRTCVPGDTAIKMLFGEAKVMSRQPYLRRVPHIKGPDSSRSGDVSANSATLRPFSQLCPLAQRFQLLDDKEIKLLLSHSEELGEKIVTVLKAQKDLRLRN